MDSQAYLSIGRLEAIAHLSHRLFGTTASLNPQRQPLILKRLPRFSWPQLVTDGLFVDTGRDTMTQEDNYRRGSAWYRTNGCGRMPRRVHKPSHRLSIAHLLLEIGVNSGTGRMLSFLHATKRLGCGLRIQASRRACGQRAGGACRSLRVLRTHTYILRSGTE